MFKCSFFSPSLSLRHFADGADMLGSRDAFCADNRDQKGKCSSQMKSVLVFDFQLLSPKALHRQSCLGT